MLMDDGFNPICREFEALKQQYEQLQRSNPTLFPPPHGNTKIDNLEVLRALQHIAKRHIVKNGCTWRDLPQKFGKWSSIQSRFSDWEEKWAKEGTFDLIKKELDAIDWTVLLAKHTLTRRRALKGYAPPKENHNEDSESAVSSAEPPSESDTATEEVAQSEDKIPPSATATQQTMSGTPSQQDSDVDPTIFTGGVLGKYGAKAKIVGRKCQKFRVLAGSTINPDIGADSLTHGSKRLREDLIAWGVIEDNKFVKDWDFSSSTAAAEVVCGYKRSPSLFWKGLKEFRDSIDGSAK